MPLPFPNIPAATDFLSISQAQIQANFNALNNVVSGIFDQVGAAPALAATQLSLYNRVVHGANQLCVGKPGALEAAFTEGTIINPGFFILPSRFCVKFGNGVIAGGGAGFVDVAYNATYPFNAAVPYVCVTAQTNGAPATQNNAPTLFVYNGNAGGAINPVLTLRVYRTAAFANNIPFFYWAIGPI